MEKCLSYNFHIISKNGWKKIQTFFCGCLILMKQSGKKNRGFRFLKKMLIIQFPYMKIYDWHFFDGDTKIFQVILKIWPRNFFVFFSTANRISYANKHFSKKFFCMQNLIFCVHNVVLDAIILAFTFFWLNFFFFKIFFSCMGCLYMPWSMSDHLKKSKV